VISNKTRTNKTDIIGSLYFIFI
jgi:hypothetical protein